jgi:EmrB/QacA subfamily drug resistance transporter
MSEQIKLNDETSSSMGESYKWIVLLITTVGAFMTPLDSSIVSIALPTIARDLRIDFAMVIWVPTAYLLCLTVLLTSFGRLADIKGRKPLFILGFTIFTIASLLSSVSQSGMQLIIFRAIQGAGAALISANSPAIVTDVFPSNERGKALGVNTMAVYVGLSIGPTLGGLLVQSLGWRSIFYINLPIGIFVITLSILKLKESMVRRSKQKFDLMGAGTLSIGLTLLLLALTFGGNYGWGSPLILGLFTASGVSLIIFIFLEKGMAEDAVLDVSLFLRNRLFAAANFSALLNYTSYFAVSFLMSFYLQRVLNYSPTQAGLLLLPMPLTMAALAPISGWASDKLGSRLLSSVGMALICISLFIFSTLNVNSSGEDVLTRLFILGVGMGLFSSPNTSAVMGSVEKQRLGLAGGVLATMRFMGQSMSLAIAGAVLATTVSPNILSALFTGFGTEGEAIAAAAFIEGLHRVFLVSASIAAIGVVTSLVRGKGK